MKCVNAVVVAVLLPLTFATAAKADWVHRGIITGPNGNTTSVQGSGSCDPATASCSRTKTWTGPYGGTTTKNVTLQELSPGVYERNVTTTGPNGRVYKRRATITRN
jgi:hypothetical protein